MPTAYEAAEVEPRLYAEWVERGYFHPEPGEGEPFCIVLPPPNVTGALHMGHALDHTIQDVIVRRRRMQGRTTLWLPGTDHAGIGTEVLVTRQLRDEGVDKQEIGREAFIERVWEWKERFGGRIVEQMKALGNSCDWERLRFTMDEGLQHAVRVAFVRLYDEGLIYRGERIVNWCPTDRTAISDSEVEHREVDGELVTFRYELADGSGHLDVATTRLETMLGDTGIAVHPDDERYRDLVGKTVRHPFDEREVPIVADSAVDPSFGTGAVKVTPAHDPADFEIAERAGLPLLNIFDAGATTNENVPEAFRGLDRYEARERVRQALSERSLILHEERPYPHVVGHCYRCGSEIEPWLSGKQWFVAVQQLTGPATKGALDGRVRFFPERWSRLYTEWLENLRDWNISRQLWWGHRIPVWYCAGGHEFASVEDPAACAECGGTDIEQDPDVLDTWFSSQLWPFSTLGWPEDTADLRFFYPTSVLVTGYEILYLWVARMIMSGLRFADDVPFDHVVIHGLVRDRQGRKMSKSLGNVIDPLEMIERYGADALRFSLMRMASESQQDIPFGEEAVEAGKHFANKLWNAARLVLSQEDARPELPPGDALTLTDRWLLSRHEACRAEVDAAIEGYRFAEAAQALYRFLWSELCDWGLELAKPRLYEGTPEEREAAARVLAWVLERSLRLLHPIMPFVTDTVWRRFEEGESVVVAAWPEPLPEHRDETAEERFAFAEDLVTAVRRFRSDHNVAQRVELTVRVRPTEEWQGEVLTALDEEIRRLTRAGVLERLDDGAASPGSARLLVQGAEVLIPLEGVLDTAAECDRIRKRLGSLEADTARAQGKLSNEGFTAKAPADVVQGERDKLAALRDEEAVLRAQLDELGCS